jgi:hypothetical protein
LRFKPYKILCTNQTCKDFIQGELLFRHCICYSDARGVTLSGKETKRAISIIDVTYEKVCEAHFSIMHQLAVMRPYVKKHLQELHDKNQDEDLIMKQHKLHFTIWLKDLNLPIGKTEEEKMIHLLTSSPHILIKS